MSPHSSFICLFLSVAYHKGRGHSSASLQVGSSNMKVNSISDHLVAAPYHPQNKISVEQGSIDGRCSIRFLPAADEELVVSLNSGGSMKGRNSGRWSDPRSTDTAAIHLNTLLLWRRKVMFISYNFCRKNLKKNSHVFSLFVPSSISQTNKLQELLTMNNCL